MKLFLISLIALVSLIRQVNCIVNESVIKSIELSSSIISVSTQFKLSDINQDLYSILLSNEEFSQLSSFSIKSKSTLNDLNYVLNDDKVLKDFKRFDIDLSSVRKGQDLTVIFNYSLNDVNSPLPKEVSQNDLTYSLSYKTYTHVISPYDTKSMKVKLRSPTQNILKFGTTFDPSMTTKSGSVVTYGPWTNVKSYSIPNDKVQIIYEADHPKLIYSNFERSIMINHLNDDMSIKDDIVLFNNGPKLHGQFTRLTHQAQTFLNIIPTTIANTLSLKLPSGIYNPYYVDQIGNVTTSSFRPSQSTSASSVLDIKPRFPLMGGWKYSFTVGFHKALSKLFTNDGLTHVRVPFANIGADISVPKAVVKIILPEGVTQYSVDVPFETYDVKYDTTYSYFDTVGRPTIIISKNNVSDKHNVDIIINYNYGFFNAIRKPLTFMVAILTLIGTVSFLKNINWSFN